jgi:hypothetical protein
MHRPSKYIHEARSVSPKTGAKPGEIRQKVRTLWAAISIPETRNRRGIAYVRPTCTSPVAHGWTSVDLAESYAQSSPELLRGSVKGSRRYPSLLLYLCHLSSSNHNAYAQNIEPPLGLTPGRHQRRLTDLLSVVSFGGVDDEAASLCNEVTSKTPRRGFICPRSAEGIDSTFTAS